MAGVGRGRGRLPQTISATQDLPRRPELPRMSLVSSLESMLAEPLISPSTFFLHWDSFLATADPPEIKSQVQRLFDHIIKAPKDVDLTTFCQIIYLASKHKTNGATLYKEFFSALEKHFEARETLRKPGDGGSMARFALLFAHIVQYTRNLSKPPFNELIDGLQMLAVSLAARAPILPNDTKAIALCVVKQAEFGRMAGERSNAELLERGCAVIRGALANASPAAIPWLCLAYEELFSNGALPPLAQRHFVSVLGDAALQMLSPLSTRPIIYIHATTKHNYDFKDMSYNIQFI